MGFNIAEAVNFATPDWLPDFPKFKACECHSGSVHLDPFQVRDNLLNKNEYNRNVHFNKFLDFLVTKENEIIKKNKKI